MMAGTRIANVAFFRVDGNGNVISKDSITEPLSSHLTGSYEQRVIEDSSNPSTLGYPTVKEYIEREALADYAVESMSPDAIITVETDDSLATTFAVATNADTLNFGFNLGGETTTMEYSDGTTLGPATSFNHTWSPSNPPNSATSDFSHLTLGGMVGVHQIRSADLTSLQLPSNYVSNLTELWLDGNDLTTLVIPAEATSLTELRLYSNSEVINLQTYGTWPLDTLWNYNCLNGDIQLQKDWPMVDFRSYNAAITGSYSVPPEWGDTIETCWLHINPNMTDVTIPNTYTKMKSLAIAQCSSLTSFTTHKEWVSLESFSSNIIFGFGNYQPTIETHKEWVNLQSITVDRMGLKSFKIHPEWTSITSVSIFSNSLDAAEIDQCLIDLDACGTSNGGFQYHNCPGSADVDRSAAAATAKANLQARGWFINPA
jgi:hypothetical protein